MTIYVTYDLLQNLSTAGIKPHPTLIRGAKKLFIPGALCHWEIGEFESSSGKKVYGVRIRLSKKRVKNHPEDPSLPEHLQSATQTSEEKTEIIEVPANAQNVQVYQVNLPAEYRLALNEAA